VCFGSNCPVDFNLLLFVGARQDVLGQFSIVNLELFNIVEDIKKVSKAFVVHPRNVNAENATSEYFIYSRFCILLCFCKESLKTYQSLGLK